MRQTGANEHRRVTMSMERCYWIYILASAIGGTLYIGVTNNLVRRVYEHKMGLADHKMGFADGFTKKYHVHRLVYFEQYNDIEAAIVREKRLKKWNRAWKVRLIEELNPIGMTSIRRLLSRSCCHSGRSEHSEREPESSKHRTRQFKLPSNRNVGVYWMPAFAGMTEVARYSRMRRD